MLLKRGKYRELPGIPGITWNTRNYLEFQAYQEFQEIPGIPGIPGNSRKFQEIPGRNIRKMFFLFLVKKVIMDGWVDEFNVISRNIGATVMRSGALAALDRTCNSFFFLKVDGWMGLSVILAIPVPR